MGNKALLLAFAFIFCISTALALPINDKLHLNIQTTDGAGNIITGTFNFTFYISNETNCTTYFYFNEVNLTTDTRGIISYYLPNVTLPFSEQYYLCYLRNGVLQSIVEISRVPYAYRAKNVTWSGVEGAPDMNNYYNTTYINNLNSTLANQTAAVLNFTISNYYNTTYIDSMNTTWTSTYNSTYAQWAYNQTQAANNYTDQQIANLSANFTGNFALKNHTHNITDIYANSNFDMNGNSFLGLNQILDSFDRLSYDLDLRRIYQTDNSISIDAQNGYLNDGAGNTIINWMAGTITDLAVSPIISINFGLRTLYSSTGSPMINYTGPRVDVYTNLSVAGTINATHLVGEGSGLTNLSVSTSTYNATYDTHVNNLTLHNETFHYNQTTPAINYTDTRLSEYYNRTEIDSNNASWSSTYNATYDATTKSWNGNASMVYNHTIVANNYTDTQLKNYYNRTEINDSYIPYNGANKNVNLGENNLSVNSIRDRNNLTTIDNYNRQMKNSSGSITFDWSSLMFPVFTVNGFLKTIDGTGKIDVDNTTYLSGNPFDQSLNTTDIVNFTGINMYGDIAPDATDTRSVGVPGYEFISMRTAWIGRDDGLYYNDFGNGVASIEYLIGDIAWNTYLDMDYGELYHGSTYISLDRGLLNDKYNFITNTMLSSLGFSLTSSIYDILNIYGTGTFNGGRLLAGDFAHNNALNFGGGCNGGTVTHTIGGGLPSTDFTFSVWVNVTTLGTDYLTIFDSNGGSQNFWWYIGSDGELYLYIAGEEVHTTDANIVTGNWTHLAVKRETSTIKMFQDATELTLSSSTLSGTIADYTILKFGKGYLYGFYFNGKMDELGIWDMAVTDTNIKNVLANASLGYGDVTKAPWNQNYYEGWHFDEVSGVTAYGYNRGKNIDLTGPVFDSGGIVHGDTGAVDTGEELLVIGNGRISGNLTAKNICYSNGTNCNLTNTGNITGSVIYGGMFNYSDTGYLLPLITNGTYYNVTGMECGYINGFTCDDAVGLKAQVAGTYKIDFSIASETATANGLYGFGISKNSANLETQRRCYTRDFLTQNQISNADGTCFLKLAVGDELTFMVDDEVSPVRNINWQAVQFTAIRVGD